MNKTHFHHEPIDRSEHGRPERGFRTGVSLHGHTLHSKEFLNFVPPLAQRIPFGQFALRRGQATFAAHYGRELDFFRAWWTPPLGPYDAWKLESHQVRERFGLSSLVSLTDHDDIEAPVTLQVIEECRNTPVSVEWTIPYRETFFHLGVHNLPAHKARTIMADLSSVTNLNPAACSVGELLRQLASDKGILIVFNHPHWDEAGIGGEAHCALAHEFIEAHRDSLHAFELNGLRPWSENRTILPLAAQFDKPLISGGDRHGVEPNTLLNLTQAATFSEFVEEVRAGYSDILVTKQYREPFSMRMLQNVNDVLSDLPRHAQGWRRWTDRAFYLCDDSVVRSFRQVWGEEPTVIRILAQAINLIRNPQFKSAFRLAFARREEV